MSIKYNNPPIVEAIFSISFRELISKEFINKFRESLFVKNNYPESNEGVSEEISFDDDFNSHKKIKNDGYLLNSGKDKLINLKYSHITYHSINKYEGWEKEISNLKELIDAIILLDDTIYINKISCRYLNIINLPEDSKEDLAKYLVVYPQMTKLINSKGPFLLSFTTKEAENEIRGTINEKLELENDINRVIVDISVEKNVDNSNIMNTFEKLRDYKNFLFENLLRLETKILFNL